MTTPSDYDRFVDYCTTNDLDPNMEDFHAWFEDETERLREAYAENMLDWERENR